MSKRIKIIPVICFVLAMCFAFAGCGDKEENEGMVNPMKEVDEQGLIDATGIDFSAPEGAENVQYFTITGEEMTIAEMRFTLDGKKAYIRAVSTDRTEIIENIGNENKTLELSKGAVGGDISGLYYEWDETAVCELQGMDAVCCTKDDIGLIAWIDKEDKILYNLCMEEKADMDTLKELAEKAL